MSNKPLSCFYCAQAMVLPGIAAMHNRAAEPPGARCLCPDVSSELYILHERLASRRFLFSLGVPVENWMPYKCGHFIAREIRVKCSYGPCTEIVNAPEWLAAQLMYIGNAYKLCCSDACIKDLYNELERAMKK